MKKHKIEDIFSSMEDFSSVPPPELWAQIEEKLDKPKKKKRAILWWSAAACLLLGLLLPSILHFTSPENKNFNIKGSDANSVVLEEKANDASKNKSAGQNEKTSETKDSLNTVSPSQKQLINSNPKEIQEQETAVATNNSKDKTNQKNSESKVQMPNSVNAPNQSLAIQSYNTSDDQSKTSSSKKTILINNKKSASKGIYEERIAFGKQNKFNSTAKKQLSNSIFEDLSPSKNNPNLAFLKQSNESSNSVIKENQVQAPRQNTSTELAYKTDAKENSKFNSNALSKVDSVQLAELQNLEKGILTPETKKEEKEKKNNLIDKKEKWAVAVFAGVASSENTKNEKTLGNTNDSKQSNSFGVKTRYNINKKWAVGSGFKINELGQSVANVSYVSAKTNALFIPGVAMSDVASSPVVSNNPDYLLVSNSTKEALKNDNSIQTGKLDQNLRYIEMPLEVSYSVFNKNKASINLNTGGFVGKLISNNVALDGHSIGQNMSANDYVYGSTLSSTVQYRVYKKTNVFVEPAMNYYINPLNSQSFNQFQWGLNFGLNVSF
ncbi:outer membrane beta-barrel protein [Flavobacterium panacagri]|uniref:outer membrane beta-barrel protein n=1 Tax=Flavobacterium panacagri TaxID=3034146 RepID=UPI0025A5F738|nr:outer membrane beta-barrel protein [Flavobacterium panacagri]